MTSPIERVEVACPNCGHRFEGSYRASVNLSLGEEWTEQELKDLNMTKCPVCETKFRSGDALIVQWDRD